MGVAVGIGVGVLAGLVICVGVGVLAGLVICVGECACRHSSGYWGQQRYRLNRVGPW